MGGLIGIVLLGVLVFCAQSILDANERSQERAKARAIEHAQIAERCRVIGAREPVGFLDNHQIGYRCPGKDGDPEQEIWINKE